MKLGVQRRAFTLVELMIVIVIVAILAGLTTVGTRVAIIKTKQAAVQISMEQLSMAIEKYKNDIGEYPPDFTDIGAVTRHVQKRWPRCEYADSFCSAASQIFGWDVTACGPASALVFWLGGVPDADGKPAGFFLSPTDPLGVNNGTSLQREEPRYIFPDGTLQTGDYKFNRLVRDSSGNSFYEEDVVCSGPAFLPGKSDSKPFVYFTANGPAAGPVNDDTNANAYQIEYDSVIKYCRFKELGCIVPYAKGVAVDGDIAYWSWYESERFQLIHPGQDGIFGDTDTPVYRIPADASTLTDADADNVVSFLDGGTLDTEYPDNK